MLTAQWQVPDVAMEKFFFSFYSGLKKAESITSALSAAMDGVRSDDRSGVTVVLLWDNGSGITVVL